MAYLEFDKFGLFVMFLEGAFMKVQRDRYVIHDGCGRYLWGFEYSKMRYKPDFGWVDDPDDACYFEYERALACLSFLAHACDVSTFGIVKLPERKE